ncbi:MAG: hypothetical protein ACOCWM_03045 [Cyclobacteriaceae bacterium]
MKTLVQQLKPQDVLLLLKILSENNPSWQQKPMAEALGLSQSEVSESVGRSKFARLLDPNGKIVFTSGLMEFLQYGLRYVFPVQPGPVVRGIPTAHSAPPIKEKITSNEKYVWPFGKGNIRGHSILPLYPSVPQAALKDAKFYELLALVDTLRVGRAREIKLAVDELEKRFGHGQ